MHRHPQYPQESAAEIWNNLPESKLELINSQLIVGNSLTGSRYLLWALLELLGSRAALPLAPLERWWAALRAAFDVPEAQLSRDARKSWAKRRMPSRAVMPPQTNWNRRHHDAWSALMIAVHHALREPGPLSLGSSLHRFLMRLGDDAMMPDLQVYRRDHLHRLQTYYYDGPADLVIDVVLPGEDVAGRQRRYAAGGVPEYWIVDPAERQMTFLRNEGGAYVEHQPDTNGQVRSTGIPGLVCHPARLWLCLDDLTGRHAEGIITVETASSTIGPATHVHAQEAWEWTYQPFLPSVEHKPTPISFDFFLDWCPESRFELLDGTPSIGHWQGTRATLGMLLMTFGLEDAVKLQHPQTWVDELLAEQTNQEQDAARRDAWWNTAYQAAELLRERFGASRVAVVGDLLRPEPLNMWSELTLVTWDIARGEAGLYDALQTMGASKAISVLRAEQASEIQREVLSEAPILM